MKMNKKFVISCTTTVFLLVGAYATAGAVTVDSANISLGSAVLIPQVVEKCPPPAQCIGATPPRCYPDC